MDKIKSHFDSPIYFLDFETNKELPIECGLYDPLDKNNNIDMLIKTDKPIDHWGYKVHKISKTMLNAKGIDRKIAYKKMITTFGKDCVIIAHNCSFERRVLLNVFGEQVNSWTFICTMKYARHLHKTHKSFDNLPKTKTGLPSFKLEYLCDYFGLKKGGHRAYNDSIACYEVFIKLMECDKSFSKNTYPHIMLSRQMRRMKSIKPSNKYNSIKNLVKDADSHLFEKFNNINITCEVTSAKEWTSNTTTMIFLTLKDETGLISGVVYGRSYTESIFDGDKLDITGKLTIFNNKTTSRMQISVSSYKKVGSGNAKAEYNKKVEYVTKQGLTINKPVLNSHYQRIGILSSIGAAGLKDVVTSITNRISGGRIRLYNCTVQGASAPGEIMKAINLANKHNNVDILLLVRGGGAREDLNCFDNLDLAKTIYDSEIPIVTGIGHKIDTTIADLVSAKNFITPTAVAEGITLHKTELIEKLNQLKQNMKESLIRSYDKCIRQYEDIDLNAHFRNLLEFRKSKLLKIKQDYNNSMVKIWNRHRDQILYYNNSLSHHIPLQMIKDKISLVNEFKTKNQLLIKNKLDQTQLILKNYNDKINTYKSLLHSGLCYVKYKNKIIKNKEEFDKLDPKYIKLCFPDGEIKISC